MNKEILARNLLIVKQLKEITEALKEENIPVILLKGAALIQAFPEYSFSRYMDDIDILLQPLHVTKTKSILNSLGYNSVKGDPSSFSTSSRTAYIDIADSLWYLSKKENEDLWEKSKNYELSPMVYHLPPDEFFIHVLAHAAVHHGIKEATWLKDLEVIKEKWGKVIDSEVLKEKLKTYGLSFASEVFLDQRTSGGLGSRVYSWFLGRPIPLKGHILRFLFLPLKKKFNYLRATLFPSTDFLASRYNITGKFSLLIYRIFRPAILFAKLLSIPLNQIRITNLEFRKNNQ